MSDKIVWQADHEVIPERDDYARIVHGTPDYLN
jgi:hypothetical protein